MKKRCPHIRVDMVRDLKFGDIVSQCQSCGRIWKDRGKKYQEKFGIKKGETNDGAKQDD